MLGNEVELEEGVEDREVTEGEGGQNGRGGGRHWAGGLAGVVLGNGIETILIFKQEEEENWKEGGSRTSGNAAQKKITH